MPLILILLYAINPWDMFVVGNEMTFYAIFISCFIIEYFIEKANKGEEIYLRPIAGISAMEEAVGRSTEMGTSVLFVPGISGLDQIDTIAGLRFFETSINSHKAISSSNNS